jgi:hypothetical protein
MAPQLLMTSGERGKEPDKIDIRFPAFTKTNLKTTGGLMNLNKLYLRLTGLAIFATAIGFATDASAGVSQVTYDFEGRDAGDWWPAGNAGVDVGKGNALEGSNNGWVNAFSDWNAINTYIKTIPGADCSLQVWIRTNSDLTNGYIAVRGSRGQILLDVDGHKAEVGPFGAWPGDPDHKGYNHVNINHWTPDSSETLFYVGFYGNGKDAWIQVDNLIVQCNF